MNQNNENKLFDSLFQSVKSVFGQEHNGKEKVESIEKLYNNLEATDMDRAINETGYKETHKVALCEKAKS